MELERKLLTELERIAGRPVARDEELVGGAIDSLALVELVNVVEDLARERGVRVDMDRLISEESLTAAKILAELA